MGVTNLSSLNAIVRIKLGSQLDITPAAFYEASNNDVFVNEWVGGEIMYNTSDNRIYIQTETSGTSPTWKRVLTQFSAV